MRPNTSGHQEDVELSTVVFTLLFDGRTSLLNSLSQKRLLLNHPRVDKIGLHEIGRDQNKHEGTRKDRLPGRNSMFLRN